MRYELPVRVWRTLSELEVIQSFYVAEAVNADRQKARQHEDRVFYGQKLGGKSPVHASLLQKYCTKIYKHHATFK